MKLEQDSHFKIHAMEITLKGYKGEEPFLYATDTQYICPPNLIKISQRVLSYGVKKIRLQTD